MSHHSRTFLILSDVTCMIVHPLMEFELCHLKGGKNIKLLECEQILCHFKARDLEIPKT